MKTYLLFLLVLVISCNPQPKVNFSGDLDLKVEQLDSLKQKEPKSYLLKLDSNTFIYGVVNQISVDVVVKLLDETGEEIGTFDSPSRGPESFTFEIKKSGNYKLEVSPFEEGSGEYAITLQGIEPIASEPEKRVDQLLTFYSDDFPGAVIGVIDNGQMIFEKAYGKANLTHDLDFKLNTPTNIGSVSKQFTAFAILLLEKQGLLSLDDDVREHIPELPDLGEVITIKNLLNHTNGMREVYNLMPITGWKGEDVLLRDEVLNILVNQQELQAAPGEEFNYNNSAFIMLAEIVERSTETKFPKWMKKNVFEPLEMSNSYVRSDPSQIIPGASQGYSIGDMGLVESGDLYAAYGAGGIYTTPIDLAKWLNNFSDMKIGGQDVIEKLVTPGILNNGDTMTYALGIGVSEYKGLKRYSHGGADIAHRAMLIYFPDINSGVVTLSNNASFSGSVANQIVDIFFADRIATEEEIEDSISFKVDEKILEQYIGKYKAIAIGLIIEYKLEDGILVAYPTGQSSLKLTPKSDSTFVYEKIDASLVFHASVESKSSSARHTQNGNDYELTRIPDFNPSFTDLEDYTGKYFCEELETFYTILVKDSSLFAVHRNLKDIKLSPTEDDTFRGDVFFMGEVAFKKSEKGDINAFTVSNGRTKGIYFQRQ